MNFTNKLVALALATSLVACTTSRNDAGRLVSAGTAPVLDLSSSTAVTEVPAIVTVAVHETAVTTTEAPLPVTTVAAAPPTTVDANAPMQLIREETLGYSVQGRPIVASLYGSETGIPVLAVGAIHGDEQAGLLVVDVMKTLPVPNGIALWIISTVNPDGIAANHRENAAGVDLNRNFPAPDWQLSGEGTERYSGPAAASEPETQATVAFLQRVRPVFVVWWHQVGNQVDDNRSVANYGWLTLFASQVGMPLVETPCGALPCAGTATGLLNQTLGSSAVVVELPKGVDAALATTQAKGFLFVLSSIALEVAE